VNGLGRVVGGLKRCLRLPVVRTLFHRVWGLRGALLLVCRVISYRIDRYTQYRYPGACIRKYRSYEISFSMHLECMRMGWGRTEVLSSRVRHLRRRKLARFLLVGVSSRLVWESLVQRLEVLAIRPWYWRFLVFSDRLTCRR
jgi:hypothetical protein